MDRPATRTYLFLLILVSAFAMALAEKSGTPFIWVETPPSPTALLRPVIALVGLTGVTWTLMFIYRNVAVMRGFVPMRYYRGYTGEAPPEWIERPARAFMNLLEVPVLFYVLCLLMLQTRAWDPVQAQLAWWFVALRGVHASVYIALNQVPLRLATYVMGCMTLAVMWWRFAMAVI